jgi:dephospho-CoA kinase
MSKKNCPDNIILIGGYAGAGKDVVANFLVKNFGFTRYAFADALKKYVAKKYGISLALMYSQEGKNSIVCIDNTAVTIRELLISEATAQRKIDPDIWANILVEQIQSKAVDRVVISDFRFTNEWEVLRKNFSKKIQTIWVMRPGMDVSVNFSEHQLDDFIFDDIVCNTTFRVLYTDVLESSIEF